MKRYRPCILATCCVPWNEDFTFAEHVFRDQVRYLIAQGIRDLYIFGTAGEGYAVSESQFDLVMRAFLEETQLSDVQSMVGVISLSLATIIERIERACGMGATRFQISLPSWGALSDAELTTFFKETCGRFPDCEFLHYNLMRTKRLVTPEDYGRLAEEHPNLVATKNSTDSIERIQGLLTHAPQLQHFLNETGFAYGSLIGECGLLISTASTNLTTGRAYFDAGRERNAELLLEMQKELIGLGEDLAMVVGDSAHIDGAFDKMFCRLHDGRFPLRMLPPYASVSDEVFAQWVALLRTKHPRWMP